MASATGPKKFYMELSVVIPVYNEEKNVGDLISAVQKCLEGIDYELILVDDNSVDNTLTNCLAKKNARIKILSFDRNYGQSTAIKAGLDYASGSTIAILDGDLQNDPADLPEMYRLLISQRVDMVQGYRRDRHDNLAKKIPSIVANTWIRWAFKSDVHDVGCSLKVFNRKLIPQLLYFDGFHRYMALIAQVSRFKVIETVVKHHPRINGKSKYGLERVIPVCRHLFLLKTQPEKLSKPLGYKLAAEY